METTEQLEEDAKSHRDNVESTLDRLKDRMSADQIVGDLGRFLGMDDPTAGLRNLGNHVKSNPVAIGMVGAGLVWFALGGRSTNKPPTQWSQRQWEGRDGNNASESRTAELAGKAGNKMDAASNSAKNKASDLAQSARGYLQDGVNMVSDTTDGLRQNLTARLEDKPMLVGGLAVVLGTIVGAMLPRTRAEDNLMGQQRDHLLQEAKHATSKMGNRAVDAAQQTLDTAMNSARDEGLLPHGDESLVSRASAVAGAALEEAKRQIEPMLSGEDSPPYRSN